MNEQQHMKIETWTYIYIQRDILYRQIERERERKTESKEEKERERERDKQRDRTFLRNCP